MDEKINLKAIEEYSNKYTVQILDKFFAQKDKITGTEILELCDIKQINLFVIYELFQAWQEENKKIRSPYFDYSANAVKEASEALMTTLSNHILVDRSHFSPLLKKAVKNTLLLIIDPYDFFSDLIAGSKEQKLQIERFKTQVKYIKINKAPLENLLQRIEKKNVTELPGNEAFALLDQILEEVNFTPEDVESYLEKFSAMVPLKVETLYESDLKLSEPSRPANPVSTPVNSLETAASKATVNDKLSKEPRVTLAENFQRIERIKEKLTINQKFMFTKVLFKGDFESFSKAVEDLDRLNTIEDALQYLEKNYMEWDRDCEEFHEFMELVEKRFC